MKKKNYTNKSGIACAILALFPIKIPHHGQSQVSLKTTEIASMKSPFAPHWDDDQQIFYYCCRYVLYGRCSPHAAILVALVPHGLQISGQRNSSLAARAESSPSAAHLSRETRPKPPYGREGQAGSWGKDTVKRVHFGVFSMSHFAPQALSSNGISL